MVRAFCVLICSIVKYLAAVSVYWPVQGPHRLRHRSVAAGLLRLWVSVPPGAWMFVVSVVCCQVEVSVMS